MNEKSAARVEDEVIACLVLIAWIDAVRVRVRVRVSAMLIQFDRPS